VGWVRPGDGRISEIFVQSFLIILLLLQKFSSTLVLLKTGN
jgi:hypothetical protein